MTSDKAGHDDRKLLELAAKAAGIDGRYASLDEFPDWMTCHDGEGIYFTSSQAWNPLTNDGDALRLVVKLKMDIVYDFDRVMVVYGNGDATLTTEYFYDLPNPTDTFAATRLAIVRAAAAIGETIV